MVSVNKSSFELRVTVFSATFFERHRQVYLMQFPSLFADRFLSLTFITKKSNTANWLCCVWLKLFTTSCNNACHFTDIFHRICGSFEVDGDDVIIISFWILFQPNIGFIFYHFSKHQLHKKHITYRLYVCHSLSLMLSTISHFFIECIAIKWLITI